MPRFGRDRHTVLLYLACARGAVRPSQHARALRASALLLVWQCGVLVKAGWTCSDAARSGLRIAHCSGACAAHPGANPQCCVHAGTHTWAHAGTQQAAGRSGACNASHVLDDVLQAAYSHIHAALAPEKPLLLPAQVRRDHVMLLQQNAANRKALSKAAVASQAAAPCSSVKVSTARAAAAAAAVRPSPAVGAAAHLVEEVFKPRQFHVLLVVLQLRIQYEHRLIEAKALGR